MRHYASVAVPLFHGNVILMRRRNREDDPWSGDMSFPGGFLKSGEDFIDAARREFEEETGINRNELVPYLEMQIFHPVRFPEVNVKPFVFKLNEMFPIRPNDEMNYGKWYELKNGSSRYDDIKGNFYVFDGDIVWGLTYRILNSLIQERPEILE
ncbi:MAG: NUDIX domain-containing protein [Candidatus Thermoplasmatota archaeon]|jgi:8-oxo-dGTP pyrophosphatase MutT (NUDIX family)|nr:NUDIX domain-containing protein [Candidatus Thermoplasmatota archaeon]MCL5790523.1 NUDIX domain-containing protein [Candidatus Thermoplasmatota archaeon]